MQTKKWNVTAATWSFWLINHTSFCIQESTYNQCQRVTKKSSQDSFFYLCQIVTLCLEVLGSWPTYWNRPSLNSCLPSSCWMVGIVGCWATTMSKTELPGLGVSLGLVVRGEDRQAHSCDAPEWWFKKAQTVKRTRPGYLTWSRGGGSLREVLPKMAFHL